MGKYQIRLWKAIADDPGPERTISHQVGSAEFTMSADMIRRIQTEKVWRVFLVIAVITAMLVKYLTEVFYVSNNSWTAILIAVIYFLVMLGTLRFLRRKLSN